MIGGGDFVPESARLAANANLEEGCKVDDVILSEEEVGGGSKRRGLVARVRGSIYGPERPILGYWAEKGGGVESRDEPKEDSRS